MDVTPAREKSLEFCLEETEAYSERSIVMSEIHPTMTALENCFEEELSSVPGWHSEFLELEHSHSAREQNATKQDKAAEQTMILGA